MTNFDVEGARILEVVHGSRAYGTNIEGSDTDYKGVCIEPVDHQIGFLHRFEQLEEKTPNDRVIYSLKKFCALAAECNPNVIEILNVDQRDVVFYNRLGFILRESAGMFLSKQARHKFAGYAHSQLKRIKTHRAWLLNPPSGAPERSAFGLGETTRVPRSEMGALDSMIADGVDVELPKDVLTLFHRERQYMTAKTQWDNYCRWKTQRNPERAAMEAIAGYDTKHAMHLVRLMRMCREILNGEGAIVRRHDALELLEIRRGRWSYERVVEYAEALDAECAVLYDTTNLPHSPDRVRINDHVVYLTRQMYK